MFIFYIVILIRLMKINSINGLLDRFISELMQLIIYGINLLLDELCMVIRDQNKLIIKIGFYVVQFIL